MISLTFHRAAVAGETCWMMRDSELFRRSQTQFRSVKWKCSCWWLSEAGLKLYVNQRGTERVPVGDFSMRCLHTHASLSGWKMLLKCFKWKQIWNVLFTWCAVFKNAQRDATRRKVQEMHQVRTRPV